MIMQQRSRYCPGPTRCRQAAILAASLAILSWASEAPWPEARAEEHSPGAGPTEPDSPSDLAREGVQKLLQALEQLIEEIPEYEMPEITEDGDIIIRRKPREPQRDEPETTPEEEDSDPRDI